ncbi:furin-like protease 2 [Anneissia japonica]|uniref:furin-like protease 2 n=1 Tax=Anneissia japonica TaxID=1529436 RepID=UPI001425711C|nr:furin-like protease 2 [Anneissia japonica]
MLDGDVTDAVEARSLSHNPQHVDIYSASWGPDDDGKTVDGPGKMARKVFEDGALKGRGGLGSIFVWASGNGGRMMDSCNCDGYTNTIYTLSVSSVSEKGDVPWYSEKCASTLATTYSSGGGNERQVVTVDIRKKCTKLHSGTSASAPLAAAICALALEANPSLTWRDMQHIVVNTAKPDMLRANDWSTNGAGYKVSHSYGFGLMDASAMVDLALRWTTVPPMRTCTQTAVQQRKQIRGKLSVDFVSDGCTGTTENVLYLEKVHAVLSITFPRRGDLVIHLTSPMGTRAMLLPKRQHDSASTGFSNWEFMSTHTWGEQPAGPWTLDIQNQGSSSHTGFLTSWTLKLYGTETNPITEIQPTTREPTTKRKTTETLAITTKKPLPSTKKPLLTTKQTTTFMQKTTKKPLPSTKIPLPSTKQTTTIMQGSTIKLTNPPMDKSTTKSNSHTKQYVARTELLTTIPATNSSTLNNLTSKQTTLSVNEPLKTTSHKPFQTTTTKPDCSPGYYKELNLNGEIHCNPCHPSCGLCIASGDTMCIKCLDGSLPFGVNDNDYEQAVGKCIKCDAACSKCDGPEYMPCTQCKAGWYLNNLGGCDVCHRSCKTCFTGEIIGCNEKKETPDCGKITIGEVVTGTYFDENIWECMACAKGCLICDQLGSCSEELPTTQELHSCSVGFYLDVATSTCKACHADCKTCSGPNELQCLEKEEISNDYCPDGTYLDHGLGICQHCHQRCYTCHGGEDTDCMQERPTTTPCPKGNYRVAVAEGHELTNTVFTESCLPCHKDCETCIGAGINGCTSRRSSVNDCPSGFYLKDTEFEKSCDQCHKSCLTCYGGMATECIDCHADYIKRDTYCVVVYLPLHSRPFVKTLSMFFILIVFCILLSSCIYLKIRKNSSKFSDVKYQKLEDSVDQKVLNLEDTNYSI